MVYWNTIDHDNNVYKQNKNFPLSLLALEEPFQNNQEKENGKRTSQDQLQ